MNEMTPEFYLSGIVIDCKDAGALGSFYRRLLGWTMISDDNGWFELKSPDGLLLNFQTAEEYEPPVWPSRAGKQGQMQHLDFLVRTIPRNRSIKPMNKQIITNRAAMVKE